MIIRHKLTIFSILSLFLLAGCQTAPVNQNIANIDAEGLTVNEIETIEPNKPDKQEISTPEVESGDILGVEVLDIETPEILDYPVAFVSQAPYAVWDDLHQEACEEASMIIVSEYFKGKSLTPHIMEQAILNLVEWEEENGYKIDLTAAETKVILEDYFNLKAELITEVTIERIKEELAKGKLIIVPAAGRQLNNPYFQTPGPIYHMLVIRGYDSQSFITNDVGTKRGDGFKYKYQDLIDAIHDWDHNLAIDEMTDEEIDQGRKVVIAVSS